MVQRLPFNKRQAIVGAEPLGMYIICILYYIYIFIYLIIFIYIYIAKIPSMKSEMETKGHVQLGKHVPNCSFAFNDS